MRLNFEELIKNSTQVHQVGENISSFNTKSTIKDSILEGKVLVDRWEEVVTTIFINLKHKDALEKEFGLQKYGVWGADINYFSDMPENTILLFADNYNFSTDKNNEKLYSVVKF